MTKTKTKQTKDYDDFEIGDTVCSIVHGEGKVTAIDCGGCYPVGVTFEGCAVVEYYTRDGFLFKRCGSRSLFFSPPEIIPGAVKRPFKSKLVGETVLVYHETGCQFIGKVIKDTEDSIILDTDLEAIPKHRILALYKVGEEIEL